jgi:5-methylcytosine-specific restriction endonuclease McrBC GTP-binding regulatory subunit McrB
MRYDRLMQETSEQKGQGQLGSDWKRPAWKKPDAAAIAKLMEALMQGDEAEQRETFEALKRGLDEHRPEGYKLFS